MKTRVGNVHISVRNRRERCSGGGMTCTEECSTGEKQALNARGIPEKEYPSPFLQYDETARKAVRAIPEEFIFAAEKRTDNLSDDDRLISVPLPAGCGRRDPHRAETRTAESAVRHTRKGGSR